jgi:hypothetical protein
MRYFPIIDGIGAVHPAWLPTDARVRVKTREPKHGHADRGLAAGQKVAAGAIAAGSDRDDRCSPDTQLTGPKEKEMTP